MQKKSHLLLMVMVLATSITFIQNATAEENAAKQESTPDNSVLVYGTIGDFSSKIRFTQIDPDFSPATHEAECERFFFDDIEPGSLHKMTHYSTAPIRGMTYVITSPGLQETTPLDFRAPSKPGLYYYGAKFVGFQKRLRDEQATYTVEPATWARTAPNPEREYELFVLKKVLKKKKGTAWEPVIRDRLKELGYDK